MSGHVGQNGVARLASPVGQPDHVQGPATAAVTLVEYGDYECPYCRAAVAIVEELQRVLPDELRFVFRHFPLENLHPHARRAAEAAEAAASQGKFFEMHAALFEHQTALEDEDLLRYAAEIDLDIARFGAELDAGRHADRVTEDFRGGVRSGVRGTPTFYLDDVRYDGMIGVRQLLATIRDSHPDLVGDALDAALRQPTIPRVVYDRSPFPPSSG
jgi:protein-disulfide isomerase